MSWGSWQEFVAMGGYGAYVWGSFGVAALALGIECLLLHRRLRSCARQNEEAE